MELSSRLHLICPIRGLLKMTKKSKDGLTPTEGWSVQLRSFARGSDGLAEIWEGDAKNVVIPLLSDESRGELRPYVDKLIKGQATIHSLIKQKISDNHIDYSEPPRRPSHIVLV